MKIAEKGDMSIFNTDILNFFFLATAEIIAQPMGKVSAHTPTAERLSPQQGQSS